MRAGRLVIALGVVAGLQLTTPGTWAVESGVPDKSTSVVTRLTLADGRGYLTLQIRLGTGAVDITAFVGTQDDSRLSGPDRVPVPGLGADCVRRSANGGGSLVYRCGPPDPQPGVYLAPGTYAVTIPVTYVGRRPDTASTLGFTAVDVYDPRLGTEIGDSLDTFRVIGREHFQSVAEVRAAPVTPDPSPDPSDGRATVSASLDIVAGEQVTELDVPLPPLGWRLTGTNASRLGIQCFVRQDQPALHCRAAPGQPRAFRTGRRELVVHLHTDDSEQARYVIGELYLTVAGVRDEVDEFDLNPGRHPVDSLMR